MTDRELITVLLQTCVQIQARCDAQEHLLAVLYQRQGANMESYSMAVEATVAHFHQKRLERCEQRDPGLAAALDNRTLVPPEVLQLIEDLFP